MGSPACFVPLNEANTAANDFVSPLVAISDIIASVYTPAAAYSFMVFCLLFIPCMAAVATLRREMNSRKWTAIALGFQAVTAWVITFIVYHICKVVM